MGTVLVFLVSFLVLCETYQLPPVKIEPILYGGLRVSINDDGFSRFIFQGVVENKGDKGGFPWLGYVSEPVNGTWVYKDNQAALILGDMILYTIHVSKGNQVYTEDGYFNVTFFTDELTGKNVSSPPVTYNIPIPNAPCTVSLTKVVGKMYTCRREHIFSEDFDKPSLSKLKQWAPEIRIPGPPDYEFNVYQSSTDTIEMRGGSLVITPIAVNEIKEVLDFSTRCTGKQRTNQCKLSSSGPLIVPPVISAKITTKNHFSFLYGRIEISAKLPEGNWLIPELTLEPRHSVYGSENYASGLMHVAYTRGGPSNSKKLYGGPVLADAEPYRSYYLREKVGSEEWHKEFHKYTLIWSPVGIDMYVDNERYGYISPGFSISAKEYLVQHAEDWQKSAATNMAPLDDYFYISLGLRVGGLNDFPDSPDKPWKNRGTKAILDFWNNRTSWLPTWTNSSSLMVDYVRVYAL